MNVQYVLKDEMKIPETDKKRIAELENMFIKGEMPYLNGKALPKKIKKEISTLYYRYIQSKYEILSWGYDFIKMEKCLNPSGRQNTNERYFIMTYILNWAGELPDVLTLDEIFNKLTSRQVYQIIYKNSYERVEK